MNYHIIIQDKFFSAYIEDIYKLHLEANNTFWVRGEKGELPWLNSDRPMVYLPDDHSLYVEKLRSLKPTDKLFVSWYDVFIGKAILDSGIKNELYVTVMGGDFYEYPFWYHAHWLLDGKTLRYGKHEEYAGYPKIHWICRPKNWKYIPQDIRRSREFMPVQQKLYEEKLQTIKRINYLLLPKEDGAEYEAIRQLYPGSTCKHIPCSPFSQNYDEASLIPSKGYSADKPLQILVGNSSALTNNYLDAFAWLRHQLRKVSRTAQIYTILSYGDYGYGEKIRQIGHAMFGDAFVPITSFMDREKYLSFLNDMDVMVMFHNREQACGNIMTGIVLGKPVLLKKCNPLYAMMKQQDCSSVYDVSAVSFNAIDSMIQTAYADRDKNMSIVKRIFAEDVRLERWKELLN